MITLKTLEKATAQEVFDQVAVHLLKQKRQSRQTQEQGKPYSFCAYRGDNGLKCAAGCLIGDDEYQHTMEGGSWTVFVVNGLAPEKHHKLIRSLQSLHDATVFTDWARGLREIANKYSLDDKIITTTQAEEANE